MESTIQGVTPIPQNVENPGTTQREVPIVQTAELDAATLDDLLTHETVLKTGIIQTEAKLDTLVLSQRVGPRFFSSNGLKTRIAHIAEMFQFWQGELRFRLYFTHSIFQQLKLVIAFVPTQSSEEPKYTANQLRAFHNSMVLNPSNDSELVMPIPFVANTNWLSTANSTGWLIVRVFQPMVVTQATNTDIPWTLCISARPQRLKFRYMLPAPAATVAGDPSSTPNQNDAMQDTPARGTVQSFARACSAVVQPERSRTFLQTPLACPNSPLVQQLQTAIFLPLSKIDTVFEVLSGLFDFGWTAPENQTVLRALVGPPTTFSGSKNLTLPPREDYYPNFYAGCVVSAATNQDPVFLNNGRAVLLRTDYKALGFDVQTCSFTVWIRVTPSTPVPRFAGQTPLLTLGIKAADFPAVLATAGSPVLVDLSFSSIEERDGNYYHKWVSPVLTPGSKLPVPIPRATETASGTGSFRWSEQALSALSSIVLSIKAEVQDVPPALTHFCLYTILAPDDARKLARMLLGGSFTGVSANGLLSFTMMQGSSMTDDGRLMVADQKREEWYHYQLFSDSALSADLFKTSGKLLDYAIPRESDPDTSIALVEVTSDAQSQLLFVDTNVPDPMVAGAAFGVKRLPEDETETLVESVQTTESRKTRRNRRRRLARKKGRFLRLFQRRSSSKTSLEGGAP